MDDEKRAARAARQRERRIEKKASEEAWKAAVDRYFGFLQTDYNFQITNVHLWGWGKEVTYQSPVLAIVVDADVEYNRLELRFFRLVDGEISWADGQRFYHDSLVQDRAPEFETQLAALKGLSDENVNASMALLAQVVKERVTDLLSGDLSYFDEYNARKAQKPSSKAKTQ